MKCISCKIGDIKTATAIYFIQLNEKPNSPVMRGE